MRTAALTALRDFLTAQPPGVLPADAAACTIALLRTCSDAIEGSEAERTDLRHLSRAEDVAWQPLRLCFYMMERHGATVVGDSTRAALHRWEVDVARGVAACVPDERRVRPGAP